MIINGFSMIVDPTKNNYELFTGKTYLDVVGDGELVMLNTIEENVLVGSQMVFLIIFN